jgi:hypothetical protein
LQAVVDIDGGQFGFYFWDGRAQVQQDMGIYAAAVAKVDVWRLVVLDEL